MFDINQEHLHDALQKIKHASYYHEQWFDRLTRTIICQQPYDPRDVAEDAHHQCLFGQWCFDKPPQGLREHPAFIAMEIEHRRMHQLAARLLLRVDNKSSVSLKEYDCFKEALDSLRLQIETVKHEIEEYLFNRDSLTGTENRIRMLTKLRELHEVVKRHIHPCGIAILDLDNFKRINDIYGHLVADNVLTTIAHHIMKRARPYDSVFRYGGDVFLIAFSNADLYTTQVVIGRIRKELATLKFATDESTKDESMKISMTASFGITQLDPDVSIEDSINRAEIALSAAKTSGRNCFRVWEPSMSRTNDDQGIRANQSAPLATREAS